MTHVYDQREGQLHHDGNQSFAVGYAMQGNAAISI